MGTRGLYYIYYNGIYYEFFNSQDSYPEGLGEILIMLIKYEDISQWSKVLEKIDKLEYPMRFYYLYLDTYKTNYEEDENYIDNASDYDYMVDDTSENEDKTVWYTSCLTKYKGKSATGIYNRWSIEYLSPTNYHLIRRVFERMCPSFQWSKFIYKTNKIDNDIEWYYVIDLDNYKFSIGSYDLHIIDFDIKKGIPYNWNEIFKKIYEEKEKEKEKEKEN